MSDRLDRWNSLGPEIKARYEAMGMSQRQFCAVAGISDTFWRPIERGEATNVPRPAKLNAISMALGLEPGTLSLALVGGVSLAQIEMQEHHLDKLEQEGLTDDVIGLAAKAGQLTPEGRAKVEGYIEALLAAEDD